MTKKKEERIPEWMEYSDDIFKHPATKIILISGAVLVLLYTSKYFFNAAAGSIRAFKNLQGAIKG